VKLKFSSSTPLSVSGYRNHACKNDFLHAKEKARLSTKNKERKVTKKMTYRYVSYSAEQAEFTIHACLYQTLVPSVGREKERKK